MRIFLVIILLFVQLASAQSGRIGPQEQTGKSGVDQLSIAEMFDAVNTFSRDKFAEYQAKKIPYSENLRIQTETEKKKLAAKYALIASARTDFSTADLYQLALLYWISENLDETSATMQKYLAAEDSEAEKAQTARSLIAVIAAKQRNFGEADKAFASYQKNEPQKMSELLRMHSELAKARLAHKDFEIAATHAISGFAIAKKALLANPNSTALDSALDIGMLIFEAYKGAGNVVEADTALDNLRSLSGEINSSSLYFYATDKLIVYRLETGRKQSALDSYQAFLLETPKVLNASSAKATVAKLKKRLPQYRLLGEPAPELTSIIEWFPGNQQKLSDLKGKVILLDFWATWCGPCFDVFPSLSEWHDDLSSDGLIVLGMTRYYGYANNTKLNPENELEFLKDFKAKHKLPYSFVVTENQDTQFAYGATSLPTVVLIDRKGIVRYAESGTNPSRIADMREMVLKLLAEK